VGRSVTEAIVAMPSGRGSSSSSSVLAESIRAGTGPAGIILTEDDRIVALGALVAEELYGASIPVVVCKADDLSTLESGREIWIEGATVSVEEPQPG
jgi:predicted aconitase with swiveling domain